ncbi:hypothetical protein L6452_03970 [Arctium lappa]|uniref:Uncharacterized protein n=1 Tax=Arctium lappa TaxID=4217 RepID=A0ACB9FNU9_ARCLA|nr:hypothetical protein L6452_03970 [Arctium lappa]
MHSICRGGDGSITLYRGDSGSTGPSALVLEGASRFTEAIQGASRFTEAIQGASRFTEAIQVLPALLLWFLREHHDLQRRFRFYFLLLSGFSGSVRLFFLTMVSGFSGSSGSITLYRGDSGYTGPSPSVLEGASIPTSLNIVFGYLQWVLAVENITCFVLLDSA